jgi:purine nucleosidase
MSRKIIIDTDPGQDDAVAILTALASPEDFDILGIVGVAGNVPQPLSVLNSLKLVELAGRTDVPVFAGCDRPLVRKLVTAEYVHGKTGMDGPTLPEPRVKAREQHGVDFIVEALRTHPEKTITLCPLGPMTDIATVFQRAPDVIPRIAEIVLMGGGFFEGGNTTPAAEFNVYVDPQAADIVLRAGVPTTMVPLDLSHQMLTTNARTNAFRALGNRAGIATAEMLEFFERFDEQKYGWEGGPLHDPCVIAWMLQPELFEGRLINVEIETRSELTIGMTVADYWRVTDRPRNVMFLRSGDADGFYRLLTERIARLP